MAIRDSPLLLGGKRASHLIEEPVKTPLYRAGTVDTQAMAMPN
jgi:hypothetical protein